MKTKPPSHLGPRTLRIVLGVVGAVPALAAVVLPSAEGCGATETSTVDAVDAASADASGDELRVSLLSDAHAMPMQDAGPQECPGGRTFTVALPPPGVLPDTAMLCASSASPVVSNTATRVTLGTFAPDGGTTQGHVIVAAALRSSIVGAPSIQISSSMAGVDASSATVGNIMPAADGFTFELTLPAALVYQEVLALGFEVTFDVDCGKATPVASTTNVDLCWKGRERVWESSGDSCTDCVIIAEMAPSPIPSDNQGDELPLGRVVKLRVVELLASGRSRLLFAENDAGSDARYEWRVSSGTLQRIADDVVLWTVEEGATPLDAPFGQVGVWNEEGAAVENFYLGAA